MEFIHSEQIKNWISQNLTTNFTRGFFVDVLFSTKKTKKVSVISGLDYCGQTEIISEIYSRFNSQNLLNSLYLVDLSSVYVNDETKIDDFLNKIKDINNAFFIISNMNQQEGTKIWFKQIAKIAKKQNIIFYLFVNNSGILYNKIIDHYNFNHFFLKPFRFSEYLITKEKFSDINFVDYYDYLNSYSPILARFNDKADAQILFFNQIVNLFRHDVYELFNKKYSIKTCMSLLNVVVYADIPCFNLNLLSKELDIDFEELLEIIRILDKAKILRMIRVTENDLTKKREPLYFLVFYHPINYIIFEHNNLSISDLMNNTKVLLSAFISATNFDEVLEIVYDYHVSWTEQITLIDKHRKRAYILGINNNEIGPILNALTWKHSYRVNYLNQNDLINLIANRELKNFKKYQIL
ncbi:hypothetical protein [Mycoplasma bradburyae]|uniref:Uncharacterized protein n=1 Tax=Mycoplasma bradburyae TaxID=2963128 RepID=A0AAW6HNE0_9MOLU|nr:hypothetical protein [Mycoplasma bradburyae]MDC4163363.1 hypothetical protein [Mycoplasma bradburyae]MDC4182680.1 hypothetical protein [Mycoplasma bradburyae]MDC4183352.1 hypothetical protein [Mycoplasma bradburyae]MDC4184160.1 hypothetical protein [Mycoplasma bradburyae]UTS71126.1 hypothetical protein NMG77_01535 [Mycoplasma bradburyae]